MTEDETDLLWICATRYMLGRMTYAVGNFCDALVRHWPTLPEHTRAIIKRDVEEKFERDDRMRDEGKGDIYPLPLGHDCDRAQWERVRRLYAYKHRNAEKENNDAST